MIPSWVSLKIVNKRKKKEKTKRKEKKGKRPVTSSDLCIMLLWANSDPFSCATEE